MSIFQNLATELDQGVVHVLPVKKQSKWEFANSANGGAGFSFFSASGGLLEVFDPGSNNLLYLHYGGVGVGWSFGGKLPKIPKLRIPKIDLKEKSGGGSTTDFPSHGVVYVLNSCQKDDLDPLDFQGPMMYLDLGAGLGVGYGFSAYVVGLDPLKLAKFAAYSAVLPSHYDPDSAMELIKSAKGLIGTRGANVGAQIGGGITGSLGYLHLSKITDKDGNCINDANGFCRPG